MVTNQFGDKTEKDRILEALLLDTAKDLGGVLPSAAELAQKVRQMQLGLPAEDEFTAMCAWSGKCSLIQKIDTETIVASKDFKLPDILLIIRHSNKEMPILVQVKTTYQKRKLVFTESYFARLNGYAETLGLPILVAWKIKDFGLWTLFELAHMAKKRTAFHIDFAEAFKQDLFGVLLDEICFVLKKGTSIVMEIRKDKAISQKRFIGTITDFYLTNPTGERISVKEVPYFHTLFVCGNDDVSIEETENLLIEKFTLIEDQLVKGFSALPTLLTRGNRDKESKIAWRGVIRSSDLLRAYQDVVLTINTALEKGLIRYIIHVEPHHRPEFLDSL